VDIEIFWLRKIHNHVSEATSIGSLQYKTGLENHVVYVKKANLLLLCSTFILLRMHVTGG
jgi:hypothetical protein